MKGDLPPEYTTYMLCKEFGYLPSEVLQENASDIRDLLACMEATAQVEQRNNNRRK